MWPDHPPAVLQTSNLGPHPRAGGTCCSCCKPSWRTRQAGDRGTGSAASSGLASSTLEQEGGWGCPG